MPENSKPTAPNTNPQRKPSDEGSDLVTSVEPKDEEQKKPVLPDEEVPLPGIAGEPMPLPDVEPYGT